MPRMLTLPGTRARAERHIAGYLRLPAMMRLIAGWQLDRCLWFALDDFGETCIRATGNHPRRLPPPERLRRLVRVRRAKTVVLAGRADIEPSQVAVANAALAGVEGRVPQVRGLLSEIAANYMSDAHPPWQPVPPLDEALARVRRPYVILSPIRAGSTYISRLLDSAGLVGRSPLEMLQPAFTRLCHDGITDPRRLAAAYIRRTTNAEGHCGIKITAGQFQEIRDWPAANRVPGFMDLLAAARVVRMRRRDRIAHAVSIFRSERDNVKTADARKSAWRRELRKARARPQPPPRPEELRYCYRLAHRHDLICGSLARHFWQPDQVLTIEYETLDADPAGTIGRVLTHFGVTPPSGLAPETSLIRTSSLYDDDLYERMRAAVAAGHDRVQTG